jgi:hypothetical protein
VCRFYGSKRLPITHAVDYVARLQFTGDPNQAKLALAPRNFKEPVGRARNIRTKEKKHLEY